MPRSVILYSATGCPLCARYRALFDEHSQAFEERNVTEDPSLLGELAKLGIRVTPAVVIGERAIPGFRPNAVAELLAA